VARYGTLVTLNDAPEIRERMAKSRNVLVGKVQGGKSVYGVSTGLGGSGARHVLVLFRVQFSAHSTNAI
jgi:histidine ammonia-lyase